MCPDPVLGTVSSFCPDFPMLWALLVWAALDTIGACFTKISYYSGGFPSKIVRKEGASEDIIRLYIIQQPKML